MSHATITGSTRRMFGLFRDVYTVRCARCKWVSETRTPQTAEAVRERHTCKENA